eukprot:8323316-Karenia_brevis.AAC.1
MRALDSLEATAIYNELDCRFLREVLLSAGGLHTGKVWTTVPHVAAAFLDNDHFRMALQLRLGCVKAPPGAL